MSTLELNLPPNVDAVTTARAFVRSVLRGWRLAQLGDTAQLLAGELVGNAVRHVREPLTLRIGTTSVGIRLAVDDPSPHAPTVQPRTQDRPGGVGLNLVDAFATRWGTEVRDDGKSVWFELDVDSPRALD